MKKSSLIVLLVGLLWSLPVTMQGETRHCGPSKKTYDPNKKGCCNGQITPHPENVDPCQYGEMQKRCHRPGKCSPYGTTICYNGRKFACVCTCKGITNTELLACIQEHEDVHLGDDNLYCGDCEPGARPNARDYWKADKDHCFHFRKAKECAEKISKRAKDGEISLTEKDANDIKQFTDDMKSNWNLTGCNKYGSI